ncbi:MAG: electron transfer flavoprotein subunit beta [Reinekea sp.]
MSHKLQVSVFVSIGQHPKSQRPRRADQDARALEMGLQLVGCYPQLLDLNNLKLIHVGESNEPVLRSYIGMGVPELTLLEQSADCDAVDASVSYLKQQQSRILLTGSRSECGEGSGMFPILLAEKLGWPLVSKVAEVVSLSEDKVEVLQALPRGQRRKLSVSLPCVLTVDSAAALPRQSAYGPASRGMISSVTVTDPVAGVEQWQYAPAQKRPKRLKQVKAKTAADRFKAATAKTQGDGGRVMKSESTDEKAQAILDMLVEEGVLKEAQSS